MLSDYQLTKLKESFESYISWIDAEKKFRSTSLPLSATSREMQAQDSLINPEQYYKFQWLDKKTYITYELKQLTKIVDGAYVPSYLRVYHVACLGFRPDFSSLVYKGKPEFIGKVALYGEFECLNEAFVYFKYAIQSILIQQFHDSYQRELFDGANVL